MNEGAMQQTVTAGITPNWWSIDNNTRQTPAANHQLPHHSFLAVPPHHHFTPTQSLSASSSSWNNDDCQELPDSWSQLLLGGLGCGEEDKNMQIKKLENWEQQLLINQSSCGLDVKNENSYTAYYGPPSDQVVEFQANPNNNINSWSSHTHQMISSSSPKSSCVTSLSSNSNNMLDFSHQSLPGKSRIPDPSSPECNSTVTAGGPASKKAKIQHPPQSQSTFKVRKEKLGDRITALHQMVSPFGKTDTASVLLEAIGYIRFLQSQVEALSLPYLSSGSRNISHQNHVQGERNSLFPEDPGQLVNEKRLKKRGLMSEQGGSDEETKKDLRSRGLCLVPISSTLHVGNEINGADYWAQSAFGGNFQ